MLDLEKYWRNIDILKIVLKVFWTCCLLFYLEAWRFLLTELYVTYSVVKGSFVCLLCFIEQNWNCKGKGDVNIYLKNVSNVSHSDSQQVLKGIRKSNVNKLVFGQLNINSLRN